MPAPQDKLGVQRLLGLVNYLVAKFIPGMSEITAPLRELLKKHIVKNDIERQAICENITAESLSLFGEKI
jgi:hypothetical protein